MGLKYADWARLVAMTSAICELNCWTFLINPKSHFNSLTGSAARIDNHCSGTILGSVCELVDLHKASRGSRRMTVISGGLFYRKFFWDMIGGTMGPQGLE
jgi:hypothetical protein